MTTATTVKQRVAQKNWSARCVELAQAHNLIGAASFSGKSVRGVELFSVPSRTTCGLRHVVRHDEQTGGIWCDCTSAHYGRACGHVGAVVEYLKMRTRVTDAAVREAARITRAEWVKRDHEYATMGGAQTTAYLYTDCPVGMGW